VIARYYYDPFGRRLWKEVAGTRTYFHYSDEGLIGEYDVTGTEIKTYGWKPGSTWSTDPLFMKQGGQYYWYHNDHLGTPQMMTTSSGAVVWKARYTSFGKANVDPNSTVVNPLRFPGQYEDVETGLHYNWHRYYDAKVGRYLRADPSHSLNPEGTSISYLLPSIYDNPENLHPYTYAYNNPIIFRDPTGLFVCEIKCKISRFIDLHYCNTKWSADYQSCIEGRGLVVTRDCIQQARQKHEKCIKIAENTYDFCMQNCNCHK
jgi:RHS repeat-associated protein